MNKQKIIIFGDSYSTFQGYIPEGYLSYYSQSGKSTSGVDTSFLNRVEDTWWMRYVNQTGAELLFNNSWSGSTIGYTGYNNTDCSKTSSFIYRFKELQKNGAFNKNDVDRVFVFGATNDSWVGAELGEMKFSDWEKQDLYKVLPAICYFGYLLNKYLPNAEKMLLVNTGLKPEIVECFKAVCKRYGLQCVILHDIDKINGHPTKLGMEQICEQILQSEKSNYKTEGI